MPGRRAPSRPGLASVLDERGRVDDPDRIGFVPPGDEAGTLAQIARDYLQLADAVGDHWLRPHRRSATIQQEEAEPLANQIRAQADSLVVKIQGDTDTLIRENQSAFVDSQGLFITVAAVSIALALLLGYVLSGSIVGPVRRMGTRLAAIASGDFSSRRGFEPGRAQCAGREPEPHERRAGPTVRGSRRRAGTNRVPGAMSHELRTPLNAIIGFSQVLKQQMYGELNEKQADYVDDVLSSGQHLLNLINDILDLAKVEAGRMELQPSTFELPELLENAVSMVPGNAHAPGDRPERCDRRFGRPGGGRRAKVQQILSTCFRMRSSSRPVGGKVTLAARAADGQVVISVRDTGIGISEEDQTKIFEEFYQVGASRTQEGTGLGLALTRRLVELPPWRADR